ncbi:MAG: ABC transporter permease, partial [Kiritimatiellae bacterium]|nr:ABC transporter permease [Kiritimatiellia bacterium]
PRAPRDSQPADDRGAGRGSRPASPRSRGTRDPTGGTRHDADLKLKLVGATIDLRPGGRVLQGPPMRAVLSLAPAGSPYGCTRLAEGRWVDQSATNLELVCTRNTLVRFGRGEPPPLGSPVKFIGMKGTMTAKVVGYLDDAKLPVGWPGVFVNRAAFDAFADEPHGTLSLYKDAKGLKDHRQEGELLTTVSESVVRGFTGDEQRRMDYARPLLLAGAILLALCLLVNSLLLSVEANRRPLAILRTAGLTRGGVVRLVTAESLAAAFLGLLAGCAVAIAALALYVSADPVAFPAGMSLDFGTILVVCALALAVALAAVLFALWPALAVRPLDACGERPRRRRRGMAIAFACGFAAFVAVEVWGASLMRAFVPSPEWPDAIVSLLPEGVSSFDVEKLRGLHGVKRISELYPLQLNFDPEEPMEMPGGGRAGARPSRGGFAPRPCRNALFLAAEWLPEFRFTEGTHAECAEAIASSDACVISEMISRARNLHKGDKLRVAMGGRGPKTPVELPIAGVVDLNWHMVTSRGLVRGLNRMPVMTDGPVFVSLDTMESLDARPAEVVPMTHLWVEYEPKFLADKGVFPAGREVEKAIADALGNPTGSTVRLHARDEIADGTLAHGSDLIGQAARVPFVFLLVLALGFVVMLVADADAAKRAFAVLRAVGATRGQLTARLAGGALRTAAWGMAWGLPLGALAGWLFAIKTGSVWPGLPHYFVVPWRVLAEGTAGALVFVLLVAVPTSLVLVVRAARHNPS